MVWAGQESSVDLIIILTIREGDIYYTFFGYTLQALLTGCSAGGLATLLHCDNFRARFPQEIAVKCLSDAGFFLDM
jgi:hypothetical protein